MNTLNTQKNINWGKVRLGEIITLHRGYDLPIEKIIEGSHPVIFSNGKIEYHNEYKIKGPGVLTGRSGSLGNIFYIDEDYWPHNTTLYVSDFHGNDAKFIFYLLKTIDFESLNAGTGVPTLNRNHAHDLLVDYPNNINIQKNIASVISSFDEKIEINKKLANTLEEMAQNIFKEWFINFRFPGHKKTEFMNSELGIIPVDWRIISFYDLAQYVNGNSFSDNDFTSTGLPIIKIAELKNGITKDTKRSSNSFDVKYKINNKDILFSWSGNPETSIDCFIWYKGAALLNQHIFNVKPQLLSKGLTYFFLKFYMQKFILIASNKQTTGLGHITGSDLKMLKIAIPTNADLIQRISKVFDPLFEELFYCYKGTNKLIQTRDLLLPKLMKGEIIV